MAAAAGAGMPAVALTDECNLFAMVKFYRAALAAGIKPVIGVDLLAARSRRRDPASRLTLLCQNEVGLSEPVAAGVTRLPGRRAPGHAADRARLADRANAARA